MPKSLPQGPVDGNTLEKGFGQVIDWLIRSAPEVGGYVDSLRSQHPGLTDDELARRIVSRDSLKSGFVGFVTGLGGLPTLPASIPANVVATWRIQVSMAIAIAHIYGHTAQTTDLKTDICLIMAGDAAKETLKRLGIEASKDVTKRLVSRYITRDVMTQIWKVLGPKIITKAGEESLTSFMRMVPGVGGVVGFAFDWTATRAVGRFAIRYYGGDPVRFRGDAPAQDVPLDTWTGRSEFTYSGSVSEGVTITHGGKRQRRTTVTKEDLDALGNHFRGRTVPVGTSRKQPPPGSLGEWLHEHLGKTASASHVGPVLVAEGYAERVGRSEIRVLKKRRKRRRR